MSLELWSEEEYERQWREALVRITSGSETSCLISSTSAGMLWWWPLYRAGDVVRVQNGLRFFEDAPFDLADPYASVPPRRTVTEVGEPISEWTVPVGEVRAFLAAWRGRSSG